MKAGMKPWHLEGLFSGGEYEYLRSTVSGYFLVSKITPPNALASFLPASCIKRVLFNTSSYKNLESY